MTVSETTGTTKRNDYDILTHFLGGAVSVFYQYGFELESGTYPWRNHLVHNTSGWLGPYNLVLPIHNDHEIHGRYVTTAATDYLKRPVNDTLFDPAALFDQLAGATAVHSTILRQAEKSIYSHPRLDPFADYKGTCEPASEEHQETNNNNKNNGIQPMLPRFVVSHQNMVLEHQLWSLPEASDKNSLYKVWPTFQKHLPEFPVVGPYCYEGDPQRAYAINVTYDTRRKENNSWTLTDGCVLGLPCWPSDPNPDRPHGGGDDPDDDDGGGTPQTIYRWFQTYGAYVLLLALVISLTLNCQLSFRLQQQHRRQTTTWGEEGDLEEPLLLLPSIEVTPAEAPANPAAEVAPMDEDDGTGATN